MQTREALLDLELATYYELFCKPVKNHALSVNLLEKNVKLTLSRHLTKGAESDNDNIDYVRDEKKVDHNLLKDFELLVLPIDLKQFAGVKTTILELIPEHEYVCEVEAWTNSQNKAYLWVMDVSGNLLHDKVLLSNNSLEGMKSFKLSYQGENVVRARFGIFFKKPDTSTKLFLKSFKVKAKNCGCYKPRKNENGKWWPYDPSLYRQEGNEKVDKDSDQDDYPNEPDKTDETDDQIRYGPAIFKDEDDSTDSE